ncbi:hypothetical protein QE152_g25975 [Popillia japonica]|uniref:Uncharacterized protein n=2 Tax=Popillia japonica TaxID=7064 RepID=A0AAW1K0P0_POPJA
MACVDPYSPITVVADIQLAVGEQNCTVAPDNSSIASPASATLRTSSLASAQDSHISMHASAAASRSTKKKAKDDLIEKAFAKLLSSNYDECDVVGNNVACKLRRMDEDQRAYAEHLINNILFYGYRKKLNNNSEISLDEKLYEGLSLNNQPINHHCQSSRQRKQCVSPIYQELYNRSSSSAVESWPNSC